MIEFGVRVCFPGGTNEGLLLTFSETPSRAEVEKLVRASIPLSATDYSFYVEEIDRSKWKATEWKDSSR